MAWPHPWLLMQAQDLVRQQFGSLLPKSWPHKLHIVRLLTNGQGPQTAELSGFMARAICSKAAALACDGAHPQLACTGSLQQHTG